MLSKEANAKVFVVLTSRHFGLLPLQTVFFKEDFKVNRIDIRKDHRLPHVHIRRMHNVKHIHEGTLYGGKGKWVDLWK